jgi:hypothetical protein
MSNIKNPIGFWSGVVALCGGAIFIYFAADFENTNLNTYYEPKLIQGGLYVLGFTLVAIGLIKMLVGYFSYPKSTSTPNA